MNYEQLDLAQKARINTWANRAYNSTNGVYKKILEESKKQVARDKTTA